MSSKLIQLFSRTTDDKISRPNVLTWERITTSYKVSWTLFPFFDRNCFDKLTMISVLRLHVIYFSWFLLYLLWILLHWLGYKLKRAPESCNERTFSSQKKTPIGYWCLKLSKAYLLSNDEQQTIDSLVRIFEVKFLKYFQTDSSYHQVI